MNNPPHCKCLISFNFSTNWNSVSSYDTPLHDNLRIFISLNICFTLCTFQNFTSIFLGSDNPSITFSTNNISGTYHFLFAIKICLFSKFKFHTMFLQTQSHESCNVECKQEYFSHLQTGLA